jgi:hypothetical protein
MEEPTASIIAGVDTLIRTVICRLNGCRVDAPNSMVLQRVVLFRLSSCVGYSLPAIQVIRPFKSKKCKPPQWATSSRATLRARLTSPAIVVSATRLNSDFVRKLLTRAGPSCSGIELKKVSRRHGTARPPHHVRRAPTPLEPWCGFDPIFSESVGRA